jgi:hypothetical protein
MATVPGRHVISLEDAREAKRIVQGIDMVGAYATGIGIGRCNGVYCVSVNLERDPPPYIFSSFPTEVSTTSGDVVPIRYRVVGPISVAV